MVTDNSNEALCTVVVNHEEQFSVWPAQRPVPAGWKEVGKTGSRAECLAYIETAWKDMRPRSLREHLATPGSRKPN